MERGQMNPQTSARRAGRGGRGPLAVLLASAVLLLALASATSAAAAPTTGGAATTSATTTETAPPATPEVPPTEAPTTTTPTTSTTEPVAKLTRAQIKRLQRKLRVPADGVLGPRTRMALRRFQARHHLTADGRPHLRVLALLRIPVRTSTTTTTAAVPAPESVQPAIEAAQAAIGASYASGATGPSSFDCSGLMVYAFGQAGIQLPRTSYAQFGVGTEVALTEIQAGDLVFFDTAGSGASHVGIALSPETAISATSHGVMEHPITTGYWGEHLIGARRVG
jgi:cell wall-associated NlpC family hydrolase